MEATIITIGDEILIGQIIDTNTASIARYLNDAGIVVREKKSIGDNREDIIEAVDVAMRQCEVSILTGGLGPTKDDITKRTLSEWFSMPLVQDAKVADHVKRMTESRGIVYNELNVGQSFVPDGCKILFNDYGTAPGMWFERGGHVLISLPGVPFEMEHLMQDKVMPLLKKRFQLRQIVHRTLITSGLAESMLAKQIEPWENALPSYLHLAYLPSPDKVRLRLSAYEVDGVAVGKEIETQFERLCAIIPQYVLGYESATIERIVHQMLIAHGWTLSTAESCTGGAIASRFTTQPGASAYFRCGWVTYATETKHTLLGVPTETIVAYGVVSEEVARAMAEGARRVASSDFAIATTGVAGPTGGTEKTPVGTVWMAVAGPKRTVAICRQSGRDRDQIITRASGLAITLLKDEILFQISSAENE
jgi:nicotinamide-nucleotide amidase